MIIDVLEMLNWEKKRGRRILVDAGNLARLSATITVRSRRMSRLFSSFWAEVSAGITPKIVKYLIDYHNIPFELTQFLKGTTQRFVEEKINKEILAIAEESAVEVVRRVNALPRKDFAFSTTRDAIKKRVERHGATLVTRITEAQFETIRAILLDYVIMEAITPYELQKKIRRVIGLTERYAKAVLRLEKKLLEAGISKERVVKQVSNYAAYLHKVRGENIARTEISFAWNSGQFEAIRQAVEEGWLEGEVVKVWMTSGQEGRMCEECEAMDGEEVPLSGLFSAGVDAPPLHPSCLCTLVYEMRS